MNFDQDTPEKARQRIADALIAAGVSQSHMAGILVAVEMLAKAELLRGRRQARFDPSGGVEWHPE